MAIATALVISYLVTLLEPEVSAARRPTRIAFGEPMPSLDTYRLYYFVQLRHTWSCLSDQTKHDDLVFKCQEDYHRCGGTLIHPEFVLTAAHCLMYYEVAIYEKGRVFPSNGSADDWVRDTADLLYYSIVEGVERLVHAIVGFFVVPKPRHTVYSDWSLLMGSHDMFTMKQKRHVMKVFPHSVFPYNKTTEYIKHKHISDWVDRTLNSWHDIALLRVCEPFKIKAGEVELAPMSWEEGKLREQYERIVRQGKTCLYAGFGLQDNEVRDVAKAGYPYFADNLMKHTWRSSMCYSICNQYILETPESEHTCVLCSHHHGYKLGTALPGDSGSPVTCDGRFVATMTKALLSVKYNYTTVGSYPLHCIIKSISEDHLAYYKQVPYEGPYHPLNGTNWRWSFTPKPPTTESTPALNPIN